MKCPMTFNDPCGDRDDECRGAECMWYVRQIEPMSRMINVEACAIALIPNVPKFVNAQKTKED